MPTSDLKQRTKEFAVRIVRLTESLPNTRAGRVIGDQVLRSGTSVSANYRAACRARSRSEFIAKMGIVVEEVDETLSWLELISELELIEPHRLSGLLREADELTAICVTSRKTAQANQKS